MIKELDYNKFFFVKRSKNEDQITISFSEREIKNYTFDLRSNSLYNQVLDFINLNPNNITYNFFLEVFNSVLYFYNSDFYQKTINQGENYKKELKNCIYNDLSLDFLNYYGSNLFTYTLNDHCLDEKVKKLKIKTLTDYGFFFKDLIRDLIFFHSESIYHFIDNKDGKVTENDKFDYFINIHLTKIVNFLK